MIFVDKIFKCDCGTEGVIISVDDEEFQSMNEATTTFDTKIHRTISLSLWGYGIHSDNRRSWKDKFFWCWKILRTGYPFKDEIILNIDTAKALGEELIRLGSEK